MKDCLFCKIVKGEVKTGVVLEAPKALAFKDINPVAAVHILIVPKKHIDTATSITSSDGADLVAMHQAAKKLVEKLKLTSYRLAYNGGKYQHVPHLHMHLLSGDQVQWDRL
ncbi:HIT domain-containing protein [Candidatus Curtissbacteria bacterium]|nr:HIT domain-containing protein [Candidatus Curtissbacteria bacterium]